MELRFLHGDFGNIKYKLQVLMHGFGAMGVGSMWVDVPVVEQTQEPEKCADGFMLKHPIPRPKDRPNPLQEPECEHDWIANLGEDDKKFCRKCNKKLKPAKKECAHDFGFPNLRNCIKCGLEPSLANKSAKEFYAKKDNLAERLEKARNFAYGHETHLLEDQLVFKHLADEARQWAVEVVESCDDTYEGCYISIKELIERLKGGRGE